MFSLQIPFTFSEKNVKQNFIEKYLFGTSSGLKHVVHKIWYQPEKPNIKQDNCFLGDRNIKQI